MAWKKAAADQPAEQDLRLLALEQLRAHAGEETDGLMADSAEEETACGCLAPPNLDEVPTQYHYVNINPLPPFP